MPGVFDEREYPLEESQGPEMVKVSLDARHPFDGRRHVRLPGGPSEQAVGRRSVAGDRCHPVATQRGRELRGDGRDSGETAFEQGVGPLQEERGVVGRDSSGDDVFFENVKPAIDDAPKGTIGHRGRGEPLHQPAVDGFQLVEGSLGLGDLHLAGHVAALPGPISQPACEERLATAVVAPHRLEHAAAGGHGIKFGINRRLELLQADAERIEARPRHRAPPQRIDDLAGPLRADTHHLPPSDTPN